MPVRVKICGVTQVDDAKLAWEAGADAIGLHFWGKSPRALTLAEAERISETRPDGRALVGVFNNDSPEHIRQLVRQLGLNAVQLHGDEPADACQGYGVPVAKSVRLRGPEDVRVARGYVGKGDVIALVVRPAGPLPLRPSLFIHWQLASVFQDVPAQVIVGGGLTAGNVADAIRISGAYAVDVTSGVELAPGLKEPGKLRGFIAAARAAVEGAAVRPGIFG